MINLLLVRHGQTVWNTKQKIQGHLDSPLTELGKEQVKQTADFLKDHFKQKFGFILSSDLGRALESAQIFKGIFGLFADIKTTDILRERYMGYFQGKLVPSLDKNEQLALKLLKFMDTPIAERYEVEQFSELLYRMHRFLDFVINNFHDGDNILAVTHNQNLTSLYKYLTDEQVHFSNSGYIYLGLKKDEPDNITILDKKIRKD